MKQSEKVKKNLSWVFIGLALLGGIVLTNGWFPSMGVAKSNEQVGDIFPLSKLVNRLEEAGVKVVEAEIEREHGRKIYELEVLAPDGRVYERYFDAITGDELVGYEDD